jgi:hypothetical protein
MRERDYIYDADEQTLIFTADAKHHIRVAYSDGQVWYAIHDIAKLLRYRAPGKAAGHREYGVKLKRVPHTSINVKGYTNCNCITKDALKRFLKLQTEERETVEWILNVVIPQAEAKFYSVEEPPAPPPRPVPKPEPIHQPAAPAAVPQITSLLDQLDQFIIAAVTLRRELQAR